MVQVVGCTGRWYGCCKTSAYLIIIFEEVSNIHKSHSFEDVDARLMDSKDY